MSTVKKRVRFHPDAIKGDLAEMPEDVREHIYQGLSDAAFGVMAGSAKPFGEDKRLAKVMKIVKDARDGNSYRGAYTIEFPEAIWVLDVFAKKSTQGIKTPKADIDRIVERLKSLRRYRQAPDGKRASWMLCWQNSPRRQTPPKKTKGKCMRRDTANLKAPDPEAVDLGPDNIFAQMGEPDAEERLLKTTLVSRLRAAIADRKLTQIKAGEVLGIPQPKVWELVSGGASGFSAERLIHLLNKVGVSVSLAFREEPDWRPGETFIHFDREPDTEMVAPEHDPEVDQEAGADMEEISAGPSI